MSDVTCLRLLPPSNHEEMATRVRLLREARLLSLKTNPTSFFTRYEDEIDQPLEFFWKRIEDPVAEHFVASAEEPLRYIACLVLLKKDDDKADPVSNQDQVDSSIESKSYYLGAAYVDSAFRNRGIFTQLFKLAVDWAREDARKANRSTVSITTMAMECNVDAQRLYTRLGFKIESSQVLKNKVGMDIPVVNMTLQVHV